MTGEPGNDTYIWNLGDGFDELAWRTRQQYYPFRRRHCLERSDFRYSGTDFGLDICVNGDRTRECDWLTITIMTKGFIIPLRFTDGTTKNLAASGLVLHQSDIGFRAAAAAAMMTWFTAAAAMIRFTGMPETIPLSAARATNRLGRRRRQRYLYLEPRRWLWRD